MRKYLIIVGFVATLGVGCSSASIKDFDQGDSTDKQFRMDSAACEMNGEQRRSTDGMGGLAGIANHSETFNRVYDACMRSKGYAHKM